MLDTPWQHAQYLALRSWYALLLSSSEAGITAADEGPTSRTRSSIALSMGQQLQESGLLQRLPGLMTATAERLQAAAGINPAAASAAGPACRPAQQLTAKEREHLELAAELLRIISKEITALWKEADYYSQHGLRFMEPEAHMAVAGMQYLSSVMQQVQQLGSEVVIRHVLLLHSFCNYAHNCASCGSTVGSGGVSAASQHWMDLQPGKPNYILQCACIASTIAAIRGALPAELVVTGSRAGGPPLRPEEVRQMSRLWQRCSRRADAMPDVCAAMVRLLGCSKETMLWAAGREDERGEIKRTVYMMHVVAQVACASQLQGDQQAWNKQAIQVALPQLWQLPALALLWASQHPTGTTEQDRQYALASSSAGGLSQSVMYHSLRLQHFLHGYSVWQPGQAVSSLIINEGGSRAPLPAVFLQVAQPLQCKILTQLLQLQRASVAQSPGALPSAMDSSPWTSDTQSNNMTTPKVTLTAVVDVAASNLHMMVQHSMRPDADPSQRQHAVARQLCPVFEDMLRGQAEAFTTPGRANGPQMLTLAGLTGLLNGEIPGWQIGPLADPITELAEPKALQLWGLLSTMVKFASHRRMRQILESFIPASLYEGFTSTSAVANSLSSHPSMGAPSAKAYVDVVFGAACRVLGDVLVTRGVAAVDCKTASAMLPWLVLLGRGSIFLGAELQAMLPAAAATTAGRSSAAAGQGLAASAAFVGRYKHNLGHMAGLVEGCLGGSSAATHLTNLGYDLQPLLQQLERMTAAVEEAADATGTQQSSAAHQELGTQLASVGELLCSFAHPYACNNPRCTNLAGPSEMRLVTGQSTKCGGCRAARYCSRQCLKQHWRQHKPVCQALAAAAAATAAAAAPAAPGTSVGN